MVSLLSQSVADRPLLLQGCGGTIGQDRPKVKKGKKEGKRCGGRGAGNKNSGPRPTEYDLCSNFRERITKEPKRV